MTPTSPRGAADRELVARVLAGDGPAEDLFVDRMRCIPRFLAQRNGRYGDALPAEDVRDLAQDVFALVWQRLAEFSGDASLETWSYRFCAFSYLNRLRRLRRRPTEADLDAAPEPVDEAPRDTVDPLDGDQLLDALERVGTSEAAVVRAKHLDGLTFQDIARRLAISPNTAKSRYYRALRQLRDELGALFGEDAA